MHSVIIECIKITAQEVPIVAQWVKNPTSIQEDAGSIPSLIQQGKDRVLLQAAVQVADAAQIWHGYGCGVGWLQLPVKPSLGPSIGCGPKKKRKKKENSLITISVVISKLFKCPIFPFWWTLPELKHY